MQDEIRDDEHDTQEFPTALIAASTWQTTLFLGAVTLVLGIVVTIHPSGSLNVIAVLVGILAIISGLFHLVRIFSPDEPHRLWLTISALFLIVIGVVLIRHLHLTVALFGLLIGITWIVQGIGALVGAFAGSREGAVWWGVFGGISLIAGIVVTASPVTSVTVLAVLLGIWFIIMGLCEVVAAFIIRHAVTETSRSLSAQPRSPGAAPAH
jgi:uncharacterized membrane protein HdeD (DUF308 family)